METEYYRHAINNQIVANPKSFWEQERQLREMENNMCDKDYEYDGELIIQDEDGNETPNPDYEN